MVVLSLAAITTVAVGAPPARAAVLTARATVQQAAAELSASGLDAGVTATAAQDLTITISPSDLGFDPASMRNLVNETNAKNAHLSDTFKRQAEEYGATIPGVDLSGWQDFDATLSMTADNSVVVTIPAAEVQTSTSWVESLALTALGGVIGLAVRSLCTSAIGVQVVCSPLGGFVGGFTQGFLTQVIDGTLGSASAWATTMAKALIGAFGGYAWEKWVKSFSTNVLPGILKNIGEWLVEKAPGFRWLGTWLVNAMTSTGETMIEMEPLLGPAIGELSPVAAGTLSCDAYGYNGFPCVAAHSTVRALYSYYGGPLYQVQRASDKATTDILPLSAGGYANAATQDSFCASTTCVITKIYDQSPEWNDLTVEGAGGAGGADHGADAAALPVTVNGHKVYGVDIVGQTGYRDNSTTGIAVNGQAEGMYMVASGTHVNSGCCFDYGNAETSTTDTGNGHMDAVNLGTECYFGPCTGSGPWVEADLENGLFSGGNGSDTDNAGNSSKFVTAMLKNNGQTTYALKGGNAQSGSLSTWYSGPLPTRGGYVPMKQEGAIVLGTGGDNSNASIGSFFEGVMTQGYPTDAADNAVQAGIVAAGYDGNSNGAPPAPSAAAPSAAGQAVVHDGYSSVFTVNSANGHLQETYLPKMGDAWSTQDLSAKYNTPPVMAGTQPVALVHCGYTSLYTVDAATGDLQETYLPFMGADWVSQDLSAKYNTPPTNVTPTAVEHTAGASGASTGCGYTSVYTANRNGDLEETYLPNVGFPGDAWHAQDLSVNYSTPQILPGTSPVALVHCGYTSLYTADASNHHLQETYLPAIGQAWHTQDLSANYGTPATDITPTAVVHASGASGASDGCGYTSVYSVDQGSRHLQETYLPNTGFPGDAWHTQDLSANYQTPQVAPGAAPVALVHMNYTSVYTVDQGSDELQETYLPTIGDAWHTQSLSKGYNTPKTDQTPIVLLHPDSAGALDWASVYTVDEFSSHLQETYLSNSGFPGDPWVTQDLSAKYNTPPVYQRQSAPAGWSVVHDGYTSAFTVDASSGHLDESYLTAMNQPWATQDLSKKYSAPNVRTGTVPVGLYHDGYTSVFTVDAGTQHLQETYLPGAASTGIAWHTQDLSAATAGQQVANGTSPTAVFHDGYVSLYTVDAFSGDLRETYLPAAGFPGDPWQTQNLSGKYGTPQVMTGTSPVAIVHDGYTSVYTVAAGTGHLWETYLPFMGSGWSTQDLTANYGTPTTAVTPTAVFHDGYTSVYTVGRQGDLEETYLPYMGGAWRIQDLTTVYGAPKSLNVAPAALYHDGYTSVYYLTGPSDHLEEAYLPAISGPWGYQDLSANVGTPPSLLSPSPLVHYDTSGALTWTSVYTVNSADGHLRETYLSDVGFPGDPWATQDLSAKYSTPSADPPGSVMWSTVSSGESLGYARTIRLASAGAANGTMLSTFEHTAGNGVITGYLIRQSTDNGATWSTRSIVPGDVSSLAPFLYEYPQQVGGLPAGTLMLLGTTVTAGNTHASIREWLSVDHGASWASVGIVQTAGGVGDGVWEPFVRLDNSGNLAMFFSDERQNATYSQFIGEIISTDGGFSWSAHTDGSTSFGPGEIKVVASPFPADRPGMPTVAISKLGGGYVLAYEMCGPQACAVHIKTSADGDSWGSGPTDLGTVPTTADGLFLRGTPVITWAGNGGPSGGTLYLSGRNEASTSGSVPSNQTLILSNQDAGAGSWTEIAAPAIPTVGANTGCNTNYSPDLIPVDGNSTLHYTVAAAAGPYKCEELVASVPIQP